MEREERPTLPFWKLSLGQSPHCHTLLASPGPSSSYARGHTGKAATLKVGSFMIRQAHFSRGISTQVRHSVLPCTLAELCSVPAASPLRGPQL